ncbi:MAG: hypothetical protein ABL962_17840 [Fimbriimonadaceae bacterium]
MVKLLALCIVLTCFAGSAAAEPSTATMVENLTRLRDDQQRWIDGELLVGDDPKSHHLVGYPLGDLIAQNGAKYFGCTLLEADDDSVFFKHRDGVSKLVGATVPHEALLMISEAKGRVRGRMIALAKADQIEKARKFKVLEVKRFQEMASAAQLAAEREHLREVQSRLRPPNGKIFIKTTDVGTGELRVQNGTNLDAIMNLTNPTTNKRFLSVYVRAGADVSVPRIRANSYKAVYLLGSLFDEAQLIFSADVVGGEFEENLRFDRVTDQPAGQRSVWSLTLHPVRDGRAKVTPLSLEQYLQLVK